VPYNLEGNCSRVPFVSGLPEALTRDIIGVEEQPANGEYPVKKTDTASASEAGNEGILASDAMQLGPIK
jgi:hypothetical protein